MDSSGILGDFQECPICILLKHSDEVQVRHFAIVALKVKGYTIASCAFQLYIQSLSHHTFTLYQVIYLLFIIYIQPFKL